jgi:hypothetical protein
MSDSQHISRRRFLESSAASLAASSMAGCASPLRVKNRSGVIAGAIRWDAWYKRTDASIEAQNSLSSIKYFKRAPFFCKVDADHEVQCRGSAAAMDAEIHAAVRGGLKYWAFDWYAPDTSFRTAWNLYRESSHRCLINYCGVLGLSWFGAVPFSSQKWQAQIRQWATYMREPNYQKLKIGTADRPLLYILWSDTQFKNGFDNKFSNVRLVLSYLRQLVADLGVDAPYVVILDATAGATFMTEVGADAISSYISLFGRETMGPYVDLDRQTRNFWMTMADRGVPTIPIAMVGWDTRARQERPVSWENERPNPNPTQYYVLPTPKEFAKHVGAAVDFIHQHTTACPSKALLIYSWDECDEGGSLIPTLGDPRGSYLAAIARLIS